MNSVGPFQSGEQTIVDNMNSYHCDLMQKNDGFPHDLDVCTTKKSGLLGIASFLVLLQPPRLLLINI